MDTLSSGWRFRILTVVDDFTRECLGLVVDTSLTALRVARELGNIIESRGGPRMIVSDNGTELTSNTILARQEELGIEWHYVAPGEPMQNSFVEASTAGCATSASTSTCSPTSTRPARSSRNGGLITNRPHTSLNGLTPTEFAARPRQGQNWNRLSL